MVSGLPVYRGHGVTQPGIKIRFMVDPNVRFATFAAALWCQFPATLAAYQSFSLCPNHRQTSLLHRGGSTAFLKKPWTLS